MSARRAAKSLVIGRQEVRHSPGVECPWETEPDQLRCAECTRDYSIHIAAIAFDIEKPFDDLPKHNPKKCFECRTKL
ncbi:MAG: hypothetical protein JWL99_4839 [Streptomyces oryziradicis]|nr:hypothetical protein [Actinacidiphila oryziradicis]